MVLFCDLYVPKPHSEDKAIRRTRPQNKSSDEKEEAGMSDSPRLSSTMVSNGTPKHKFDPAPVLRSPAAGAVEAARAATGGGFNPPSPVTHSDPAQQKHRPRKKGSRSLRSLIRQAEFYARDVPITLPRISILEGASLEEDGRE